MCEALGYNKAIYGEIDNIYKKKRYEFYKLARESNLYNHQMITEGGLLQEEYCKKALGILLYLAKYSDEKIQKGLSEIIKKGWPYVYTFAINFNQISFNKFMERYVRKNKGIENLTDDDINTSLMILFFISINSEKQINEKDECFKVFIEYIYNRAKHYEKGAKTKISLSKANTEDKEKIKELKKEIRKKIGNVKNYGTLLSNLEGNPLNNKIAFLFDYEKLSSSILWNIPWNEKDIDEILYAYLVNYPDLEKINIDDAINHFLYGMHIKYLIKAYIQVKQHYFENNKEIMFAEVEELEKKIEKISSSFFQKSKEVEKLKEKLELSEKRTARLEIALEKEKKKNIELNSLRQFVFSLDQEIKYEPPEGDLSRIKTFEGVIIGGHEKWQQRMKKRLPRFVFIHADMLNFDVSVLDNVKNVFFYVNYLNHAIYYKTIEHIKEKNIKIHFINFQNEDLFLREIYKKITL